MSNFNSQNPFDLENHSDNLNQEQIPNLNVIIDINDIFGDNYILDNNNTETSRELVRLREREEREREEREDWHLPFFLERPQESIEMLEQKISRYISSISSPKIELDFDVSKVYCYVCHSDQEDKKVLLYKINDIDKIEDNTIFAGPCGKHFICKECLKKVSLDFENHPINRNYSLIRCLNPDEDCITPSGINTFFDHLQIQKILTKEQFSMYYDYAEIYEFPGFEIIKCPYRLLPYTNRSVVCGAKNIITIEKINETPVGEMIVQCVQNPECNYRFCYHCKQTIRYSQTRCETCTTFSESQNPYSINYYLVKQPDIEIKMDPILKNSDQQEVMTTTRKIQEETDYLYRNGEITKEIALSYIDKIKSMDDKFFIQCPFCSEYFCKSDRCSALKHCGIERCYSCGKVQKLNHPNGLGDHWSENGINGCPRFDYAPFWNNIAQCNFLCLEEGYDEKEPCYGHYSGECQLEEHKEGIKNILEQRKNAFIYHFLKSLLKETRDDIIQELEEKEYYKKVFDFLENNQEYLLYYSPLIFAEKIDKKL